ncbi:DUF2271 domain-containing protein (plasmid) [Deinococcus sp. KNUC1210]|uniref:DUF2271 domain-containing protein n=1 Tax=Deinococcus sp. KNUC1210 TaxID=2917691 RepID=UPI001EEFD0F3|nr:DUF2271 domain-containing protein [Deinococcus sp. KNUC1210]ULH17272.1 DUF2271 domain-containing protein [Deinococcus sp. KNUC1210]
MRHTIKNGIITRRGFLTRSVAATLTLALSSKLSLAATTPTARPKVAAANELAVSFTTSPSGFGRIQRPYVAVWIENASGTPIRTLSLWMLSPPRGTRYLDELRRWYNGATNDPALVPTTTSPTPNPGSYTVVWDGKDDKGSQVDQGDYYVCVESAREHGPYSLVREKVTLATTLFKKALGSNSELKDVGVEFRKHA